ncbi:MAG: FeoA family protein [Nitritalea sp.]
MSKISFSAAEMPREQDFRISALYPSPIQVQLQALGVLVGKPIRLLRQAPFRGAMAFQVGSSRICIREEEAATITVVPL